MLLLTKYTVLYKENEICCIILLSLPSRERGLKCRTGFFITNKDYVAPFAGAWIEITEVFPADSTEVQSLPSRERGLKLPMNWNMRLTLRVAPFAGAWIEIVH